MLPTRFLFLVATLAAASPLMSALPANDDGYRLWLRYEPVADTPLANIYRSQLAALHFPGTDPTLAVARAELQSGLAGLLGGMPATTNADTAAALLVGTPLSNPAIAALGLPLAGLGRDGYLLRRVERPQGPSVVVAAEHPLGVLYGSFALLRLLQSDRPLTDLDLRSVPSTRNRILNHWDNIQGSIERGYAGNTLWRWSQLPGTLDPRYTDYARACASVGINVSVLNNVNAQAESLRSDYLAKTAALADVFRPYGIRVALTARFDAPIRLDGLATADPTDPQVIAWWQAKAAEIYALIPDFAGFLVKADSEGQPGPHTYGLTHEHGANLFGDALAPHGGLVMWRTFSVNPPGFYPPSPSNNEPVSHSYKTFQPLDGRFRPNVIVQPKTGPRDFQPREIANPLFGALRQTPTLLEAQITQEYLGHEVHLVYLAPMWREVLDFDTHANGPGTTVARIMDGSVFGNHSLNGMAGVANTGDIRNWTGHPFAQANWYAFGRLAWDVDLSSETIAEEWVRLTFGNDPAVVVTAVAMMLGSWEAHVDYSGALGLLMLVGASAPAGESAVRDHYGPNPAGRTYWHQATAGTIGVNRSSTGTKFVDQLHEPVRSLYNDPATCPEELLLFFHRTSWDRPLASGLTVWEDLVRRYRAGVTYVESMQQQWQSLAGKIDRQRFDSVTHKLWQQQADAALWRDVSIAYFSDLNGRPLTPLPGAPAAAFTATTTRGAAPLTITLDASSSSAPGGEITAYAWSFGDGQPATGRVVTHTFAAGIHRVALAVTDAHARTATATAFIEAVSSAALPISLEAERAIVGTHWDTVADATASLGAALTIKPGFNTTGPTPPSAIADRVTFAFTVPEAGAYTIFCRIKAPNTEDDSFWVRVNGGAWFAWNNIGTRTASYIWSKLPSTYSLPAGAATIDFAYREDGTVLDKIQLALATATPTGFGLPDNVNTPFAIWTDALSLPPAQSAPADDPDADGAPNLLEYALGTSPLAGADAPRPELIHPLSGQTPSTLSLRYHRARADLRYEVLTSTDLVAWTTQGVTQDTATPAGGTASASIPHDPAYEPRRFLRLRVSL